MKVRFIVEKEDYNFGVDLPLEYRMLNHNLILGKEYLVLGMKYVEGLLYFLINIDSIPNWFISDFFSVTISKLPSNWQFNHIEKGFISATDQEGGYDIAIQIDYIIGYKELVENPSHIIGLELRKQKDLEIFRKKSEE